MGKRNEPPYEEELKQLSLRGLTAYAARCLRRVRPQFRARAPEHVRVVDLALRLTEGFAKGSRVEIAIDDVEEAVAMAALYMPAAAGGGESLKTWSVADTAKWATQCAWAATTTSVFMEAVEAGMADVGDGRPGVEAAIKTAAHAGRASYFAAPKDRMHLDHQARRSDFERLLAVTRRPAPALGEPINFDHLGPLWPAKKSGWLGWFS